MSVMNHLAQAAAALLLLELLVVVLIFAAVAGGLAFGLRWVNGKTEWASSKVNGYLAIGRKYVHIGTDYVAKPFILFNGALARAETTIGSLRRQAIQIQEQQSAPKEVAARPVPPSSPELPTDPLV